mmetsp:Transcript_11176/g.17561  ORF Transcript_11176/g.17561 Transcript_11176/m.17561 type:complete len:137 (+) Transcript_11176:271-681(+)
MEVHYLAGMSKLYSGAKPEAIAHFKEAAATCRLRIETETDHKLVEEFKNLLRDVEGRIEEEMVEVPIPEEELQSQPEEILTEEPEDGEEYEEVEAMVAGEDGGEADTTEELESKKRSISDVGPEEDRELKAPKVST